MELIFSFISEDIPIDQAEQHETTNHISTMESYSRKAKPARSIAALIFLTLIGVGFLFFSLVALTCGFVVNYVGDFEATDGGQELESTVESQFDYTQYWLGFPVSKTMIHVLIKY